MRIGTMTNIHMLYGEHQDYYSTADCIRSCSDVGYRVFDLSLSGITQPGRYLNKQESHREWLAEVKAVLKEREATFSQAHGVFYGSALNPASDDGFAAFVQTMRENFLLAGELEIPWMVFHPQIFLSDGGYDEETIYAANVELFSSLVDIIKETGVKVAIENMNKEPFKSAASLLSLIELLDDERFGICWDTGHANLTGQDQVASIMQMGSKLKATHIADNRGVVDDHLLPFSGTIDWLPLVSALMQSGYGGDFSFEVHNATRNYPPKMRKQILQHSYDIATYLLQEATQQ